MPSTLALKLYILIDKIKNDEKNKIKTISRQGNCPTS